MNYPPQPGTLIVGKTPHGKTFGEGVVLGYKHFSADRPVSVMVFFVIDNESFSMPLPDLLEHFEFGESVWKDKVRRIKPLMS